MYFCDILLKCNVSKHENITSNQKRGGISMKDLNGVMKVLFDEAAQMQIRSAVYEMLTEEIDRVREDAGLSRPILNQKQAANYLGVSIATFRKLIIAGMPRIIIGNTVLYSKESIYKWLLSYEDEHKE